MLGPPKPRRDVGDENAEQPDEEHSADERDGDGPGGVAASGIPIGIGSPSFTALSLMAPERIGMGERSIGMLPPNAANRPRSSR
jgi:hypothetical protein